MDINEFQPDRMRRYLRRKARREARKMRGETPQLESYRKFFNDKCLELGITGWTFKFDTAATRRLGVCKQHRKVVGITRAWAEKGTEQQVHNTILHELAHVLTPGHKHDHVWRAKAVELGCDGRTKCTHDVQLVDNPKFIITCPNNCFKPIARTRFTPRILNSTCRKCKSKVLVSGEKRVAFHRGYMFTIPTHNEVAAQKTENPLTESDKEVRK